MQIKPTKLPQHTQMTKIGRAVDTKQWQGRRAMGIFMHSSRNANWYNHFGKWFRKDLQLLNIHASFYPLISLFHENPAEIYALIPEIQSSITVTSLISQLFCFQVHEFLLFILSFCFFPFSSFLRQKLRALIFEHSIS